jgi:hypothetical protein
MIAPGVAGSRLGGFAKSVSGQLTAHCICFAAFLSRGVRDEHFLCVEILEAEGFTKETEFSALIY